MDRKGGWQRTPYSSGWHLSRRRALGWSGLAVAWGRKQVIAGFQRRRGPSLVGSSGR